MDLAMLLSFFSALRVQLQQGFILTVLIERKAAREEIVHYLPMVKPAALDKMLPIIKRRQTAFFKRALDLLFDMELLTKSGSLEPGVLFDLVLTKIFLLSNPSGEK